ncbi:MAG TPA: M20/M25/M40 family metallo-hydrolase [Bacteroidales bacterium]|nr:M20/M25/M40 family metallo-hydrolase [Bacteroidales bacterium]
MKPKKLSASFLLLFFLPLFLTAQEKVDLAMIYKIKQEGLKNSNIEELAFWLTDFVGPRLTGSDGNARGNEWAKKRMEEMGLQNVRIEAARDFKNGGWDNLKAYTAMTAPYYCSFACNPVAWTGSTPGLVKTNVVLLNITKEEELEKYKGTLKGKIVLLPSGTTYTASFEPLASRYTDEKLDELSKAQSSQPRRPMGDMSAMMAQRALRTKITEFLKEEGAAAILLGGGAFNVPRSTSANYTAGEKEPVCQVYIPLEAHGRLERMLNHNIPVEVEIDIQNRFFESPSVYNVIAEIPGTDKLLKNEVVLLGAHIDSWHGGTGAADNASGCIVMMEAMRILKSLNVMPRRTIRIALWGGEEQGLNGSRGYVEKYLVDPKTKEHKPDYKNFAGYFNMDNGSGKYRGIYLQENELLRPVFEAWLKPFNDMEATTVTIRNTSGTDHLSFDAVGLPGFQFIQDAIEYGRSYHTVMDTYERLVMADLKQNAIITASFVYNAAMRDEKLPGKPELKTIQVPDRRMD